MTEKKGCCEKCLDYDHDGGRYCFLEKDCPCHQIPIQEALEKADKQVGGALRALGGDVQEGWKRKYYDLCREIKLHDFVPRVRMKAFIAELIASSEQRTRNEVVDYIRSAMSYHGADLNLVAEEARNLPTKLK